MTDNVTHVDFGKDRREFETLLTGLLGVLERQRAALLADPEAFYKRSVEEIVRLRRIIEEAQEAEQWYPVDFASSYPDTLPPLLETVIVDKDQWKRLIKMRDIITRHSNLYPERPQ